MQKNRVKKIGCLGAGNWGYALANLLASKNEYDIICWTSQNELKKHLQETGEHFRFPGHKAHKRIDFTNDLKEAIDQADLIVESITVSGIRPVFEQIRSIAGSKDWKCPIVFTSKGIEQHSKKIVTEIVRDLFDQDMRPYLGILSGPSFAQEVIKGLPAAVVAAAYDKELTHLICDVFTTPAFRVYPNEDLLGVAICGALKNIIAIACGISDGLSLGSSSKAALMTRGLHEIRKLVVAMGGHFNTVNGLSGMGDICLTCNSTMSRNFSFGLLLAAGKNNQQAQDEIGMVVEGAHSVFSALELAREYQVEMPIAETVLAIMQGKILPKIAVEKLMQRQVKNEFL